jgi:hypothetical protein
LEDAVNMGWIVEVQIFVYGGSFWFLDGVAQAALLLNFIEILSLVDLYRFLDGVAQAALLRNFIRKLSLGLGDLG